MTGTVARAQQLLAGLDWSRFVVMKTGRIRSKADEDWCPLQEWHGQVGGYMTAVQSHPVGSTQLCYDIMAAADYDGRRENRRESNYRSSRELRKWMLAQMRAAKARR